MKEVEKIEPTGLFTNYIYKAIPLAFDESMSYYETLCGLLYYLKHTVIPTVNNNADALIEVQNLMVQLQQYVDNYFDNLDVQDEINNKLDDMVEQGTLQEIIADYLDSKAVFGFDTVSSMKQATNLLNGSYARTLGYHSKNDGGCALYKIRTITNDDVVDESLIIALNDNTLIAELIINDFITPEQFGSYGDGTHDDTTTLQNAINSGYKIIGKNSYSITSVYLKNNYLKLLGRIDGQIEIGRNATLSGGEIHSKNDNAVIEIVNDVSSPRNMNSLIENVKLYPTTNGIGIYLNATEYSMFNFTIQNCEIESGNIGIKFENANSHWITKCDLNNIFLHSPTTGIKMINTGNQNNMTDIVLRNVYAQYYNNKPNYFIDADLVKLELYDCICYDGIGTAIYNITNDASRLYFDSILMNDNTYSPGTNPKVFVFNQLKNSDGGNVLRVNRNFTYLPQITNGLINPTASGTSGLAMSGLPFFGLVGMAGANISASSKYSALGFWNGRLCVGYSDTLNAGSFSMVEVQTPYSGQVFTTETLPTTVRDGATCFCSDIHMNLTYYNHHWWYPDGTQFTPST